MPETLGEVWRLGWKAIAHCYWFPPLARKQNPWCDNRWDLDMMTLIITRGEGFPLARMDEMLKCPRCGERKMRVLWEVPKVPRPEKIAINNN